MATNLQVNAQTSQAVGAFNALTASIQNAQTAFDRMSRSAQAATNTFQRQGSGIGSLTAGFDQLTSIIAHSLDILRALGAGIEFVFTSIVRELDKLQGFNAIMSVTAKSSEVAADSYNFLRGTADKLGVQFDALSSNYSKLVAAIPDGAQKFEIANKAFLGIAEAARTLHASNQDTQLMFYAITQTASKGVVSMEELRRQLGEKLPGALQIAARAVGTNVEELTKAIGKGLVDSAKFLPYFGDELIRTFSESSAKASTSVSAAINRLTNVWVDFVKQILDSGAGQSIINVFDALREKLSDPYLIERFASLVKYLADKFTDFIKNLTQDDIRNGFDTFTKGVEIAINLIGKLIEGFTWVINHAPAAGAALGGILGASAGLIAGPIGAAVGGVVGATGGGAAGYFLSPSPQDNAQRAASDATAAANRQQARLDAENLKYTQLIPLLQQFKGLKSLDLVGPLLIQERSTQKTLDVVANILTNPKYNESQRTQALLDFSKYGIELGAPGTLKDVMGKGKPDKELAKLQNTMNKGFGLQPTFFDEWNRLTTLFKTGKIDLTELEAAQKRLLDKQPVIEEFNRSKAKSNAEDEKGLDLLVKQITTREKVRQEVDDELRLAGMRNDQLFIEQGLTKAINEMAQAGIPRKEIEKYLPELQKKLELTKEIREVTQAEDQVLDATVNKYKAQITQQKAIKNLLNDPSSGFSKSDATNLLTTQDQNFAGSPQWIESQKKNLLDYYAYINGLRNADLISEESANQAKAAALSSLTQQLTAAYVKAADLRLQAGSTDVVDVLINSLGRLAAGFSNFTAGASNILGNFFQSFTDGFANSIGRAIVYSENLGDAIKNVARQGISELISSLVKLGIQYVTNALLGTSIAASTLATTTATSVTAAAATAAAWAPAAAAVSLASFGANAAPAIAGIVAANTVSEAFSLSSFAGFQDGGYTGNGSRSGIAGVVHGREFVVNADATARNRATLEAMNRGQDVGASNGDLYITVEQHGTPQSYSAEWLSPNEVRLIARDEARKEVSRSAPSAVAADLNDPNSVTSKAIARNTKAERKRA